MTICFPDSGSSFAVCRLKKENNSDLFSSFFKISCLDPGECVALPFVHAFSRCDTVSSFTGRGKRSVWDTFKTFDKVTPAFCALASTPSSVDGPLDVLERFVVLLYDRASTEETVAEARKQLFSQKCRSMDGLSPTQAALVEHTKRSCLPGRSCLGTNVQSGSKTAISC